MNKREVNQVIVRLIPDLMKMVISKSKHRARRARKKGYPDEFSAYQIEEVKFWVYYFFDQGADVNQIFCRYHDNKGAVYAYVNIVKPGQYSIVHFLKHAIDRYNSRLKLGLDNINDMLFHVAKNGLLMVRKEMLAADKNWLEVGWRNNEGLWLGKSENNKKFNNMHVNMAKTFIDNDLIRKIQEAQMNDRILEKLLSFEKEIGGDARARKRISQLIRLFKG